MQHRIVLAYSGSLASSTALRWLIDRYAADVVAVIVDVGQTDDLGEVYTRALACGAMRAHVIDRRKAFAHHAVLAVARPLPLDDAALERLAHPVIASALVELAAIEGVDAVAHAADDDCLGLEIARIDPTRRVIAAASEWKERGVDAAEYLRRRHLSPGVARPERHLFIRPMVGGAPDDEGADVTIQFEAGIPVAVNGVAMELDELIESLSLIGGQYGLSASPTLPSPAAMLLHAARRDTAGPATVTLRLKPHSLVVIGDQQSSANQEPSVDQEPAGDEEPLVASFLRKN